LRQILMGQHCAQKVDWDKILLGDFRSPML